MVTSFDEGVGFVSALSIRGIGCSYSLNEEVNPLLRMTCPRKSLILMAMSLASSFTAFSRHNLLTMMHCVGNCFSAKLHHTISSHTIQQHYLSLVLSVYISIYLSIYLIFYHDLSIYKLSDLALPFPMLIQLCSLPY